MNRFLMDSRLDVILDEFIFVFYNIYMNSIPPTILSEYYNKNKYLTFQSNLNFPEENQTT